MLTLDESSIKPALVSPMEMPEGSFGIIRVWPAFRDVGTIVHRISIIDKDEGISQLLLIVGHRSDDERVSDYWRLDDKSLVRDVKGIEILPAGTAFKVV